LYNCTIKFGASVILTGYVRFFFAKKEAVKRRNENVKKIHAGKRRCCYLSRDPATLPQLPPPPARHRSAPEWTTLSLKQVTIFYPGALTYFSFILATLTSFSNNITVPGTLYPQFFSPARKF
jgi:hypothetical protein